MLQEHMAWLPGRCLSGLSSCVPNSSWPTAHAKPRCHIQHLVTGNGRAVTHTGLCNCSTTSSWVSSPHPSTGWITPVSTGSLLNWKKCIYICITGKVRVFYIFEKNDQAKAVLISLTDRHCCSREAASSAGDGETWWGHQRLSMELQSHSSGEPSGVSVLREKSRAAATAWQSLFIAHTPQLHVQSGHHRQL